MGKLGNKLMELITSYDGRMSHTKTWSNIGMFVMTIAFLHTSMSKEVTPELLIAYGGIVVAGRVSSKYLDGRGNQGEVSAEQSTLMK